VAVVLMFASVASAQDAKTVVANAQKAMGYSNLNTIVYSGPMSHEGAGLGQWMSPTKGWHQNTVRDFTRFIDYNAGTSQRVGLQNRPGDPATGLLPGGGGLDPSAAPPAQNTNNIAANGTWTQRLEVTLSPPAFLKAAAAAPNVTAKSQSVNGKKFTVVSFPVEQKAPSGVAYTLTGYINSQNQVEKVVTAYEDAAPFIVGDVVVEQNYSDYKDFGGVQFPTRITQTRAGVLWGDATIADVKPNAPQPAAPAPAAGGGGGGGRGGGAPGAAAPGGGRGGDGAAAGGGRGGAGGGAPGGGAPGGAPGGQAAGGGRGGAAPEAAAGRGGAGGGQAAAGGGRGAAAPAAPRKLADGVFVVGGGYQSMAIEFKDHIVMVEAPQNGIADIIAQVKQAIPNKPITHVILTHNHWDHAGGVRTVLAEGPKPVTLVTNAMSKTAFEKWFSNPRTLQATTPAAGAAAAPAAPAAGGRGGAAPAPWPDALQASGKKVKFQYVKDKLILKDDTQTVEIYALNGALHGEDMVVVYVPKAKAIFESDAYNPGAVGAVTNPQNNGGQLAFQKLLASEMDRLKIDYTTIVSGHAPGGGGRDASKTDLMVAIGKQPPPAGATPAPARGQ
jgi:glyoxylase-like metal-dependent hydrolase (beta-lactamase superfamily II)